MSRMLRVLVARVSIILSVLVSTFASMIAASRRFTMTVIGKRPPR